MKGIHVLEGFGATVLSVVVAVLPLVLLFVVFQILMLRLPRRPVVDILKGTLLASAGLLLFLQGVHIGFLPFGRALGEALGTLSHRWLLMPLGFLLGFLTAWGEPSVRILADQVEDASSGSIRHSTVLYAICTGVALIMSLGMLRIVFDIPLLYILVPGYLLVIVIIWFSDKEFLSIAVDAGGVATGPMANTFLLALALGISASMGDQNPIVHGLGLVALIALAPIISVMALGFILNIKKYRKE
ncbi:DUF1538 domain-containing protein [Syntrophorhabdus aromaticivorans]|uniref:DUF1538 domain-containing protein n=1 Tax=Syntrophorhabdus aromaticivorans TaxID=328301 RepID=UPI0003F9CBFB|nr:DUF1538 domain-containing protein [Syntrophorhabdus aromaticivorans]